MVAKPFVAQMNGGKPVKGTKVEKFNGTTKNYRDGEMWSIIEPRCRVCSQPDVRKLVDNLTVAGYNMSEIYRNVESSHNSVHDKKHRVSYESIRNHIQNHLNVQDQAIQNILERRATEAAIDKADLVRNIVTPQALADTIVLRAQELASQNKLEISARDGIDAARASIEFEKYAAEKANSANAFAVVDKIMESVKIVCEPEQLRQIAAVMSGEMSIQELHNQVAVQRSSIESTAVELPTAEPQEAEIVRESGDLGFDLEEPEALDETALESLVVDDSEDVGWE